MQVEGDDIIDSIINDKESDIEDIWSSYGFSPTEKDPCHRWRDLRQARFDAVASLST